MSTTYNDLKAQIKALEAQAEELRKSELASAIADVKSKIAEYGISAEQLGFTSKSGKISATKNNSDKKPVAPKYAGPNGKTWTGRGITPAWLAEHIVAGGKKEDFLIAK